MYVLRNIMQFNGLVLDKQNTLENNNMNSILQFAFEIVCCLLFVFFFSIVLFFIITFTYIRLCFLIIAPSFQNWKVYKNYYERKW